jgi:hypothetical protein
MACNIQDAIDFVTSKVTNKDKLEEVLKPLNKALEAAGKLKTIEGPKRSVTDRINSAIEADAEYQSLIKDLEDVNNDKEDTIAKLNKSYENKKEKGGAGAVKAAEDNISNIDDRIDSTEFLVEALREEIATEDLYTTKELEVKKRALEKQEAHILKLNEWKADSKKVIKDSKSRVTRFLNLKGQKDNIIIARAEILQQIADKRATFFASGRLLAKEPSKKIKRGLVKNEKPVRLSDYFTGKDVYNNLSATNDLFGKDFEAIKDTVEVREDEELFFTSAKNHTNKMIKNIEDFVANGTNQTKIKDLDITDNTNSEEHFQSISRLLLEGEPGKYTLPSEVVTAMALGFNDWLAGKSNNRAHNRGPGGTNLLLGRGKEDPITFEEIERVADIDGFTTSEANSIGAVIYNNLGLKVKQVEGENRELLAAKMKLELGLMALEAANNAGLISISTRSPESIFGKAGRTSDGKNINVFQITGGNALLDVPTNKFAPGTQFANKIMGTTTNRRDPSTVPPKKPNTATNKSLIGKFFTTAEDTVEALNVAENTAYTWDDNYVEAYKEMVKTPEGRQRLRVLLGWKDPAKAHKETRLSVNGKNAAIEANMGYLEEWNGEMEASGALEMYFPWFFGKNGRFFLDTNTFNPQGKKLHRFAVNTGAVTLDTAEEMRMQLLGLAQAFGVDIDKKSEKSAIEEWKAIQVELDTLLEDGKTDLDILEIAVDNKWFHDIEHTLSGLTEYKRYKAYVAKEGSAKGMESHIQIETDAITSGSILSALQMPFGDAVNTIRKGGVFVGDLIKNVRSYGKQAEKPGYSDLYESAAEDMSKIIPNTLESINNHKASSKEHKDALLRATELTLKAGIGKLLLGKELTDKEAAEGVINNITRKFMKSPYMTFKYGSSLGNVVKAIAKDSIETLYDKISKGEIEEVATIIEQSSVSFVNYGYTTNPNWVPAPPNAELSEAAKNFAAYLRSNPDDILETSIPPAVEQAIKSNIEAGVGSAITQSFTKNFGEVIEANRTMNKSFQAMFKLFKVKLDKAIAEKQRDLGARPTEKQLTKGFNEAASNQGIKVEDLSDEAREEVSKTLEAINRSKGIVRHLTEEETNEVITTLKASLPAIELALSGKDKNVKLMIFGTKKVLYDTLDGKASETGKGRIRNDVNDPNASFSGQGSTYELIEAAAAGSVVPIHYTDGSIQSIVGKAFKALGIHDANMFTPKNAMEGTREYNKGTSQVSTEYSLTSALLEGFIETLNEATPEEVAAADKVFLSEFKGKNKDKAPKVMQMYSDMVDLHRKAEDAREVLFAQDIRFEHAALEGSHFDRKGGYTRIEPTTKLTAKIGKESPKKTTPTKKVEKVVTKEAPKAPTGSLLKVLKTPSGNKIVTTKNNSTTLTSSSAEEMLAIANDYNKVMVELGLASYDDIKTTNETLADTTKLFSDIIGNELFTVGKVKVTFKESPKQSSGDYTAAQAFTPDNKVELSSTENWINTHPAKVALHEYAHILTVEELSKNKELNDRTTNVRLDAMEVLQGSLSPEEYKFVSYAFTNNAEFIAESMSNPFLQKNLKSIASDGNSTLLDKVRAIFKNLLELAKADGELDNALGDVLDIIVKLREAEKGSADKTTTKSSKSYNSPIDSKEVPATITDKVTSPTAEKLGVSTDAIVAAEIAKTTNSIKKCNKG